DWVFLRGVDDVDIAEQRHGTAVRNGVQLNRLTLRIAESGAQLVGTCAADHIQRIRELRSARLIGDVSKHAGSLAVLDLPEHLPAKLKIVTLLVDRVGTV